MSKFQSDISSLNTLKQHWCSTKNGKKLLPRESAWYGPIDYSFSHVTMPANNVAEVPCILGVFKHISDKLLIPNNIKNNADSFLINKYRNGKDSCGEHSDDEEIIDQSSPVITLSLGHPRVMLIREAKNPANAVSINLNPGSVLVMK